MLFGGPRLEIHLSGESDVFWLYPTASGDIPNVDTVAEGTVSIKLSSAQRVGALSIALIGTEKLYEPASKRECFRREQAIDIKNDKLQSGEHAFAFSFLIPPNSSPSINCEQGRVEYKLVATLSDSALLGSPTKVERHVLLQVSHAEEKNGYPPSFSMEKEVFQDRFGPMRIELMSRYLLVAGYLRVYFYLPDIPHFTKLELWAVEMIQTITIGTAQHESRYMLWSSSEDPLANKFHGLLPVQDDDGPWIFSSRQMRLPKEDRISPTTHPDTDTPIRVSHRFIVRIIFFQYDGPGSDTLQEDGFPGGTPSKQMLEFSSSPAVISSCSSRIELSRLPTYEESAKQKDQRSAKAYMAKDCFCRQATVVGDETEIAYGVTREQVRLAFEAGEQQRAWAFREIRQKTEERAAQHATLRRL